MLKVKPTGAAARFTLLVILWFGVVEEVVQMDGVEEVKSEVKGKEDASRYTLRDGYKHVTSTNGRVC